MKKVIMIICMLGIFSACTKKDLPPNPTAPTNTLSVTFKKDSSIIDQTIQAPKNNQFLFQGQFNTGSINGFSLTSVRVKFIKIGDGDSPNNYLKRINLLCDGTFSGTPLSLTTDSVNSNEFSFTNFVTNFGQYKIGTIKISADILSNATNGTGLEDGLIVEVQLTYTGYLGSNNPLSHFQTEIAVGHKTIFSTQPQAFTISSVADLATPASGIILHGEQKPVLRYGLITSGASGNVTEHRFLVQGQATGAVSVLKLFDASGNFIAQANVSGGVATINTNEALSLGIQKNYVVEPVINISSGNVSNYDFRLILDEVKAFSSITGEQKTDGADRIGNLFRVFKSKPTISKILVPTLTVVNNSVMTLYTISIKADNGSVGQKQVTYEISLNDQGFNDTLFAKTFQVFHGNTDVTNEYRFTDANGVIDTIFTESDSKLFITRISGLGEIVIPENTTLTLSIKAFIGGFNHPSDGDNFTIKPLKDLNSSVGLKYVNSGGVQFGNSKLHSSAAGSSSAQTFFSQWTDFSSNGGHSGLFGSSSNDWIGGENIFPSLAPNTFHQ